MAFNHPEISDPALSAFAVLAEKFCDLIESRDSIGALVFSRRLHLLLPEIYAAGLRLPSTDVLFDEEVDDEDDDQTGDAPEAVEAPRDRDRISQDAWSRLYNSLAQYFGEFNYYREVYDPYEPHVGNPEVTGSLADDISDIYQDLHSGLRKWRRGESGAALWEWRFGLESHWGEHITGAIRALHCRAAWRDTGWPHDRDRWSNIG